MAANTRKNGNMGEPNEPNRGNMKRSAANKGKMVVIPSNKGNRNSNKGQRQTQAKVDHKLDIRIQPATQTLGVFTGHNVLNLAMIMPDDGKIVCCDVSEEFVNVGKPFFKEAKVDHKLDIRIQPATQTLDELLAAGEAGTYDFVFIDADKTNYDQYYEKSLQLVRVGGIIAVDNVFGFGGVWFEEARKSSPDRAALHELNLKIHKDERVMISMLPLGDGVTLAVKL